MTVTARRSELPLYTMIKPCPSCGKSDEVVYIWGGELVGCEACGYIWGVDWSSPPGEQKRVN